MGYKPIPIAIHSYKKLTSINTINEYQALPLVSGVRLAASRRLVLPSERDTADNAGGERRHCEGQGEEGGAPAAWHALVSLPFAYVPLNVLHGWQHRRRAQAS